MFSQLEDIENRALYTLYLWSSLEELLTENF
jgi:hypothetical protein